MNSNRHAGPLLSLIKMAGFAPTAERVVIDPLLPFDDFTIRLPLIGASYYSAEHKGYYRPVADGEITFAVRPPNGADDPKLVVDGANTKFAMDDGLIVFTLDAHAGSTIRWIIR
ncbi:MAG: hypothetical protein H6684_02825 [Deltaproteobacteria bacterium]|nr:hypothetical protein [Deltaproteobacteria bacterium]